jgi:hypothetical protein
LVASNSSNLARASSADKVGIAVGVLVGVGVNIGAGVIVLTGRIGVGLDSIWGVTVVACVQLVANKITSINLIKKEAFCACIIFSEDHLSGLMAYLLVLGKHNQH